jgi:hypothetical protein
MGKIVCKSSPARDRTMLLKLLYGDDRVATIRNSPTRARGLFRSATLSAASAYEASSPRMFAFEGSSWRPPPSRQQ